MHLETTENKLKREGEIKYQSFQMQKIICMGVCEYSLRRSEFLLVKANRIHKQQNDRYFNNIQQSAQ